MNKITLAIGFTSICMALSACQTTPRQYNGMTGYQIEHQSTNSVTLAYTLAGRADQKLDESKLQRACQKVLNSHQNYKISVLSVNEIINPALGTSGNKSVQLGQSRTSFGLSNTQSINSSEDIATRQALESRPSTLSVVRYTCT